MISRLIFYGAFETIWRFVKKAMNAFAGERGENEPRAGEAFVFAGFDISFLNHSEQAKAVILTAPNNVLRAELPLGISN